MRYCSKCGHEINHEETQINTDLYHTKTEYVIATVLKYFGMDDIYPLVSKSRKTEIVYRRQVTMSFLRKETTMSLESIGEIFNRDHTTVMHSVQKISDLICTDDNVKDDIKAIEYLFIFLSVKP